MKDSAKNGGKATQQKVKKSKKPGTELVLFEHYTYKINTLKSLLKSSTLANIATEVVVSYNKSMTNNNGREVFDAPKAKRKNPDVE